MQKIPTLFVRDSENRKYVLPEVNPGCEWVIQGEGKPTRKIDGTCVRLTNDGLWWFRREIKVDKTIPLGFVPVEVDEVTGKIVGWEPAENSGFKKWLDEALSHGLAGYLSVPQSIEPTPPPGTYELIGPKINGNPEGVKFGHLLVAHGYEAYNDRSIIEACPRTFEDLRDFMQNLEWEGIVWHHPDGRMAKLKRRDFPVVE